MFSLISAGQGLSLSGETQIFTPHDLGFSKLYLYWDYWAGRIKKYHSGSFWLGKKKKKKKKLHCLYSEAVSQFYLGTVNTQPSHLL